MAGHIWWKVIVCGSNINNTSHSYSNLLWKEVVKNTIFKARFLKHSWILHLWLLKNISAIKIITQTEPKIDSEKDASKKQKLQNVSFRDGYIFFQQNWKLLRNWDFIKAGRRKTQKTISCFSVLWKHFSQIHSYADIPCKYNFMISLLKFSAYGTFVSKEKDTVFDCPSARGVGQCTDQQPANLLPPPHPWNCPETRGWGIARVLGELSMATGICPPSLKTDVLQTHPIYKWRLQLFQTSCYRQ